MRPVVAALLLAGCAAWPDAGGGPVTPGPWPALLPLEALAVPPGLRAPADAGALRAEAAALGARAGRLARQGVAAPAPASLKTRAARLRALPAAGAAVDALDERARILRGPAATEEEREAMRARLARLPS